MEQSITKQEAINKLWKRPEGIFGIITGIGLFGLIGYLLYKALPFLITLATNVIWLVVEIIILCILVYILLNKDTWRNFSLLWYQLNRKILSIVVDMDPISVLHKGISEMVRNLDIIHQKVNELGAIIEEMKKKLKEYKTEFDENTHKKKKLDEKIKNGNLDEKELFATRNALVNVNNSLVRGQTQIIKQQERLNTSEKYYKVMEKLEVYAGYKIQDAKNDLYYKEEEFKQAKATRSAMKSIMSILKGGLSESIEQELALASINETVNLSISEMRRLIDGSNDILNNFELNSEINADKAEALLKEYEAHGFDIFNESETHNPEVDLNMRKALCAEEPVVVEQKPIQEIKSNQYFS